jgi:hypothetical protein
MYRVASVQRPAGFEVPATLFAAQNEIIPVDHLGAARVAQDQQHIA